MGRPSSISENSLRLTSLRDILLAGGGGGAIIGMGNCNGIMLQLNGICNIGSGDVDDVAGRNCWWKGDCNNGSGDVDDVMA